MHMPGKGKVVSSSSSSYFATRTLAAAIAYLPHPLPHMPRMHSTTMDHHHPRNGPLPKHACSWMLCAGEHESSALLKEINKQRQLRPLTHDVAKNILNTIGYRVTKIRITEIVANTWVPGRKGACG